MADPAIGQLAASTWERVVGTKPADNIFRSRYLFYMLGEKGFKEGAAGGRLFEESLEFAENSTHASVGEFDTIDTTRVDVFDAARFEQKIVAGSVTYSELELLRNQADMQKFDLLAEKLENNKDSHSAELNRQMWSDGTGNGGKDVGGIQLFISATPTTGTVGGINGATFSFWRNQQVTGTQTSSAFDNLRASLKTCFNSCSRGAFEDQPQGHCTTQTVFEGYEGLLTANERYDSDDKRKGGTGDAGFDNTTLRFKGKPVAYDEDCPSGNWYMLTNKAMKFRFLKGGWMKMYPAVDPSNQLANVHKLATFGNFTVSNRRRLGVVSVIT